MAVKVDDWFVASKHQLFGQSKDGSIVPFEQSSLYGFRGEGGARDAQLELQKSGHDDLRLVRLEMQCFRLGQTSSFHGRSPHWVILSGCEKHYSVYGPSETGEVVQLNENKYQPFSSLAALELALLSFFQIDNIKPESVFVATWYLHIF